MDRKTIAGLWIPAVAGIAVGTWRRYFVRPRIEEHADLFEPESPAEPGALQVTFLGVTGMLLDDSETAIMIDGFFTRPRLTRVLAGALAPDEEIVGRCLARAGVDRLSAVICGHSHYDHALDSPVVAARTGATLVGSASTANIGRGHGLAEDRLRVPRTGEAMRFGDFTVTLLPARHSPGPRWPGTIDQPLRTPARVAEYAMGECYSILVEHRGRRLLVQPSAGYRPGALDGVQADVVYLAIGLLGRQSEDFRRALWHEVVGEVGARRVVLTHWDDFTRSLDRPLTPPPRAADDFETAITSLLRLAREDGVDLRLPVLWRRTAPFAGIPTPT